VSEKRCKSCGQFKERDAFHQDRRNSDGLHTHCKARTALSPGRRKCSLEMEKAASCDFLEKHTLTFVFVSPCPVLYRPTVRASVWIARVTSLTPTGYSRS
jgi:hypothetical protein